MFFPLDERWGLSGSVYSPGRAKQMVWLSGLLPYEQAAQVFERIGHCVVPGVSIWRQTGSHGQRLQAYEEQRQAAGKIERMVLPPAGQDHRRRKGISMDGGMVHLRKEGWKEFKVGAVFNVEKRLERDPRTGEAVEHAHGTQIAYCAVVGSVVEFRPALWELAVRHDVPRAADSSVVGDGAEWIWNLANDCFPDSVQVVDWFHACEHLAGAALALYPNDESKAQRWFKQRRDDLFKGHVHTITLWLENFGRSDLAAYFHKHKRRMRYQEFCEEGYPIGSGTVESGVKQFKARLTGPGMQWTRSNAQTMLTVRGAVMANNFDTLWEAAA